MSFFKISTNHDCDFYINSDFINHIVAIRICDLSNAANLYDHIKYFNLNEWGVSENQFPDEECFSYHVSESYSNHTKLLWFKKSRFTCLEKSVLCYKIIMEGGHVIYATRASTECMLKNLHYCRCFA